MERAQREAGADEQDDRRARGRRPLDPATFGAAALLLLVCAAAAGYVPARRAARVDPVVTLRSE